ncbi:MAG: dTDP-4-dehydrorhamnose reductase [Gammaproteobacteria bacterium]|nr:dTDP-4-dehydrorhamnose reductase [Gammaproteobacteria bacterium]
MKILLLGKNGQVGWELQRSLAPLGELIALDRHSKDYCGDLTNLLGIAETVYKIKPDIIVNAAAYTAVDNAETEVVLAHTINALAPGVLAKAAHELGAWLIHYSTDYVFNGAGHKPWLEGDAVAPLNVYGKTKYDGEQAIINNCNRYLIFRTSWVYAARGANFAKTMLRLARERDRLTVINDQVGAPTSAELIADVTAHAIRFSHMRKDVAGIYHLAAQGETSWYDYAHFVIDGARALHVELKVANEAITPIPTTAFPTPAARPHNSRLNTNKLCSTFELVLPAWQIGVNRMLRETLEKS